jgi:hypothetical protein
VLTGYKLPFKTTDFRLVECPLSVRPDILPGPMSANHPKAAVRGKWARMSAYDPKRAVALTTRKCHILNFSPLAKYTDATGY